MIAHCWPDACTIPHLCLAHVDSDARVPAQRHTKKVVNPARPVRWGHNGRVIEEREKVFARQQMTGNILQSAVLPEGIQQWHHCEENEDPAKCASTLPPTDCLRGPIFCSDP